MLASDEAQCLKYKKTLVVSIFISNFVVLYIHILLWIDSKELTHWGSIKNLNQEKEKENWTRSLWNLNLKNKGLSYETHKVPWTVCDCLVDFLF